MALPLIALKFTYKIKQLFENSRKGNKGKKKNNIISQGCDLITATRERKCTKKTFKNNLSIIKSIYYN